MVRDPNENNGSGKYASENGFEVEFPPPATGGLNQDQEWCIVREGDAERRVRFHSYDEVYSTPGLYEYLFYRKLECNSPSVVCSLLDEAIQGSDQDSSDLTVLDLGAGNGMMGQELQRLGVDSVVGVDIIPEARLAAERDRPDVYEDYYVVDLADPGDQVRSELEDRDFNCLTTVAALGFGDIPPRAFREAFNLIQSPGWLAFNIKETFLGNDDSSGFSRLLSGMVDEALLDLVSSRRYRHRLSVGGEPLYYMAIIGRKRGDIPAEWIGELSESDATTV